MTVEAKGEARLEPVDVDVLDNLVNAQAAYLDAVAVAGEHFGIDPDAEAVVASIQDVLSAFARLGGAFLVAASVDRV